MILVQKKLERIHYKLITKFKDFLLSENRFAQLSKINPDHAADLMDKCEADAKKRRARLDRMTKE